MKNAVLSSLVFLLFTMVISICGVMIYNCYLETRRAQEQKELSQRMVAAVEEGMDKIPEFKLLGRRKDK